MERVEMLVIYVCIASLFKKDHCRKDVRLPVGFQRAMAAEAESAREARAKVGRK